jgi:hypothetical protein
MCCQKTKFILLLYIRTIKSDDIKKRRLKLNNKKLTFNCIGQSFRENHQYKSIYAGKGMLLFMCKSLVCMIFHEKVDKILKNIKEKKK